MWTPQRNRGIMLHPFFECTFSLSFGKEVWLTALTVGVLGPWICYAADSNGNIDLLKKGSEENEVERHVASFMNRLTRGAHWEKVHDLGITHLELIRDENILVSLAYDATCKVLDPSTGQVLFQVCNKRRCMYTGATWVKNLTSFYLIDEAGMLDVFNLYHERVVETVQLSGQTPKQMAAVLKYHASQALSHISQFNQEGYFLTVRATHDSLSSAVAPSASSAAVGGFSSSVAGRLKSVGVMGDLVLWNLSNDINCMEFVGHEGSVVGIAVPTFTSLSAAHTLVVGAPLAVAGGGGGGEATAPSFVPHHGTVPVVAGTGAAATHVLRASSLQISSEEKLFFSAGHEDDTLRCWDEYDQLESYQFKSKHTSEITVMLAVWHMNRIVTGHENGTVCIWNADTGTKVVSKVLKHTISSLVEASSAHSKLLIGADYSGKIATWNLTLHYLNPTQLIHVGNNVDGYHLREDPGILSLCFHDKTKTMFSGGNDNTVRFWRLHSDICSGTSRIHNESVSLLRCTSSFLLSGDEDGNLCLCRILTASSGNGNSVLGPGPGPPAQKPTNGVRVSASSKSAAVSASPAAEFSVVGLGLMCAWNAYPVALRPLGDLVELDLSGPGGRPFGGGKRILVTCVGPAGSGRTKVWEVWTQKRSATKGHARTHRALGGGLEGLRQTAAKLQHELELGAAAAAAAGGAMSGDASLVGSVTGLDLSLSLGDAGLSSSLVDASSLAAVPTEGSLAAALKWADAAEEEEGKEGEDGQVHHVGRVRIFDALHADLYISATELFSLNHDKYEISCCCMSATNTFTEWALGGLGGEGEPAERQANLQHQHQHQQQWDADHVLRRGAADHDDHDDAITYSEAYSGGGAGVGAGVGAGAALESSSPVLGAGTRGGGGSRGRKKRDTSHGGAGSSSAACTDSTRGEGEVVGGGGGDGGGPRASSRGAPGTGTGSRSKQASDALEKFRQSTLVYLGTVSGTVFRFSFKKF
jgi:WD40 repeat protein